MTEVNWGPTGELVYNRTYSRVKPDGSHETWPETVQRVVDGNLALVEDRYHLRNEREDLIQLMTEFKILPGGRHLWASGVANAQHLFNCWVAGWTDKPSDHFEFSFMRLMEGGGVGSNYSNSYLAGYPEVQQELRVHIVCDEDHQDYPQLYAAGVLSEEYDPDWAGAFVIEDSREGWAAALVDLIDTFYREDVSHFNRVYDVSRVRHAGAKLKTFGGTASGPLPLAKMLIEVGDIFNERYVFADPYKAPGSYQGRLTGLDAMAIDHAIASCVVAGGVRRSARMSMMHWRDPQVFDFIHCKQKTHSHWTTNISVEVNNEFWQALSADDADNPFSLAAHAKLVLDEISTGMVRNGEPGFWDSSYSNQGEPNEVICTNPCGEITLQAWEPCNLGHVNLAAFILPNGKVDILGLIKAHELITRFLIRATFSPVGDPKSREVLDRNRRTGVGHLGVASFLALQGKRYSKAPADKEFRSLLRELAGVVDDTAADFSHELRIPVPVKLRTIAPTGTIAKMPGVSEGIHPIFAKYFIRRIRFSTVSDQQMELADQYKNNGFHVEDDQYSANSVVVSIPTKDSLVAAVAERFGEREAEEIVESAADLTLNEMLAFQAMYQTCWADNAVSFTANVDPNTYQPGDVADQILRFGGLLKGATIFPEASMPQAPYERITRQDYEEATATAVADSVDEECANGACPIR